MAKTTRGEAEMVSPSPLTRLATYLLAATILSVALPASTKAEAVVSTLPARPDSFILSEGAATPRRGAHGLFVYTPGASPSVYRSTPHASSGGSLAVPRAATIAAVTVIADSREESAALWEWTRPTEWAAQGGMAVLLYGLSRKGRRRRRRGRRRVGW